MSITLAITNPFILHCVALWIALLKIYQIFHIKKGKSSSFRSLRCASKLSMQNEMKRTNTNTRKHKKNELLIK